MQKLNNSTKKKILVGVIGVALTLITISVWNLHRQGFIGTPEEVQATPIVELSFRHPLTGVKTDHDVARPRVYAVMVENSSDAWPQSGVDDAFMVMEAPAEGSIPRLLALFDAEVEVDKIGPVRSARPYYIDWASAYGALYAHVGGSPAALDLLAVSDDVHDLNEFYNQYQFWRAPDRYAPHNVYTSTELLDRGWNLRHADEVVPEYRLAAFKDDVDLEVRPIEADDFVVEFGATIYRAVWKYDRETNTYARSENTMLHVMSDGAQLRANNVVVIATDMTVLDNIGRLAIDTLGEGQGLLAQDGVVKNITWKKLSVTDRLAFYDEQGTEVSLNAGQTWVEVVESLD